MNKPSPLVSGQEYKARFTTGEFLAMVDSGAFDDMKVELVDGELERMPPPKTNHATIQAAIVFALWEIARGLGLPLLMEVGIELADDTVLACDAALLTVQIDDNRWLRPEEVLLVVEVAQSTVPRDLGMKQHKYAGAGIAHYWVADSGARLLHVFSGPSADRYRDELQIPFGQPVPVPGTDRTITID